ncbi:MAG: pyocin activator PrtN family protein [Cypionkella sp.]
MTPTDSRTLFLLLAEFNTGQIPVERCAHHFGISPSEAKRAAVIQKLPVPAFRMGSQKSPWLVRADDLAKHIDAKHAAALKDWERMRVA